MKKMDVHIVGLGNLGSAFLNGLKGLDANIFLYEESNEVRQSIQKNYSISPEESLTAIRGGVLLLCIKPQNINEFFNTHKDKIEKEEYVEYASVFGNFYGTSKEEIKTKYNNSNLILELDWQGAYAVKELFDDAKLIFLLPPSLDDLKQRLIKRNLDSSEAIENRLSEAKKEISKSEMYDYLVLNDDFDKAFEDLSQILFEGISPIDFNSRASSDLIKGLVE